MARTFPKSTFLVGFIIFLDGLDGQFRVRVARADPESVPEVFQGSALIPLAVESPAAPQHGFFGGARDLQGVLGQVQQVLGAHGMEISDERPELVAQHTLRQPDVAGGVVGAGGFVITFEVGQVGAQVEPGKGILRIILSFLFGSIQCVLAADVHIPLIAQDVLERGFHIGRIHHDVHAVERLPVLIQIAVKDVAVRA
jgi:hypothetical protein